MNRNHNIIQTFEKIRAICGKYTQKVIFELLEMFKFEITFSVCVLRFIMVTGNGLHSAAHLNSRVGGF